MRVSIYTLYKILGITPESKVAAESAIVLDKYFIEILDPENSNFDIWFYLTFSYLFRIFLSLKNYFSITFLFSFGS